MIWHHGVRAAITPVVTALGIDIGVLLGGAVLVEVQLGAFFIVIANLVVDVAYAFLDPRVRYS